MHIAQHNIIMTEKDNLMIIEEAIDRDSPQKLYVQIYSIIKGKIEKGEWASGMHIPSEDELCRIFDVSKATVRLAVSELVRYGYVRRQQGKGTFVLHSITHQGFFKTKLTDGIFSDEDEITRELVSKGIRKMADDIAPFFRAEKEIYYVLCRGILEKEPVFIEEMFIPPSLVPDIETDDVCHIHLYDLIQEKGLKKINRVQQTIEVGEMTWYAAAHLDVPEGVPALVVHKVLISADGSPIAYVRLSGKKKKFRIQTEFEKMK